MMQLSLHESMKHNTTTKNEACEFRTSTEPPYHHTSMMSILFKMFSKTALSKNISQCMDVNEAVMKSSHSY